MQKILFVLLLFPFIAHAQGWQWGRGNTGGSMDSWPVATDPSGNVFAAGLNFSIEGFPRIGQASIFGSYTVPFSNDSNGGFQTIISKYDANGNFYGHKEHNMAVHGQLILPQTRMAIHFYLAHSIARL